MAESKRAATRPAAGPARTRWDRKRILIMLLAVLIVVTLLGSSLAVLLYPPPG